MKPLRFQISQNSQIFFRALNLSSLCAFWSLQDLFSTSISVFDQEHRVLVSHHFLLGTSSSYSCILFITFSFSPLHLPVCSSQEVSWSEFKEICLCIHYSDSLSEFHRFPKLLWTNSLSWNMAFESSRVFWGFTIVNAGNLASEKIFSREKLTKVFPRKIAF